MWKIEVFSKDEGSSFRLIDKCEQKDLAEALRWVDEEVREKTIPWHSKFKVTMTWVRK